MSHQNNPQYRISSQLRSRINTLAHRQGQAYGLQQREVLMRQVEARGRDGLDSNELALYLDVLERGDAVNVDS